MCDEAYLLVRSPNEPRTEIRRRVRATFVCPSCGWRLQAVLEQEMTTVRCECEAQFAVRKPERRHASKSSSPPNLSRPPLRSILQQLAGGAPKANRSYSDTDSHASHPSSVQSVMVSHCSSSSSAVVSIKAPSVVSISSSDSLGRPATQAKRVKTLADREADASTAGSSASHEEGRKTTAPAESAPSDSAAAWLPLPSIVEGGWLGQMFSNTSLNSP